MLYVCRPLALPDSQEQDFKRTVILHFSTTFIEYLLFSVNTDTWKRIFAFKSLKSSACHEEGVAFQRATLKTWCHCFIIAKHLMSLESSGAEQEAEFPSMSRRIVPVMEEKVE